MFADRVLSGMRPTGTLHLGHYHGVLKNWVTLQHEYQCLFFVADWHALTTHYETPAIIEKSVWDMVVDWLAAGVDPAQAVLFIQSRVPEHAELHLLLSMITPLSWLERVPSYKDQQEKLGEKDLATYGFLGYPLLQGADILIYRANLVPVGEDQVPHIEFTREIARRFNHLYGREPGFEEKAELATRQLGAKRAKLYRDLRVRYQQDGDGEALDAARALLDEAQNLSIGDRERLFGYLEGGGKMILAEPHALLTAAPCMPGLTGKKCRSRTTIRLRCARMKIRVARKVRTMPTDPARVRRSDPVEKRLVRPLHLACWTTSVDAGCRSGCRSAGIGCLECKQPVIDAVPAEQRPDARAPSTTCRTRHWCETLSRTAERARKLAAETMRDVRQAMGVEYD